MLGCLARDFLARHDKDFLAGNGELFSGTDGREGRGQPGSAHNRDEHHVGASARVASSISPSAPPWQATPRGQLPAHGL